MNDAAERPLKWIVSLNLLGLLAIASGLAWAARSRSSEEPWFAPIVLGLVLMTWGWTIDDAARNDQLEGVKDDRSEEASLDAEDRS